MSEQEQFEDKKEMVVRKNGELAIPRTGLSVKGELTVKGEVAVKGELSAIYELATRGELVIPGEVEKSDNADKIIIVESIEAAVEYLRNTEGNVLTATGAMEIYEYTKLADYKTRLYSRVLSNSDVIRACEQLGISGRHLFGMTGPFSKEMNRVMLRDYQIRYLVTKDAGISAGFVEKLEAALELGVTVIVVASAYQKEQGREQEIVRRLRDHYEDMNRRE